MSDPPSLDCSAVQACPSASTAQALHQALQVFSAAILSQRAQMLVFELQVSSAGMFTSFMKMKPSILLLH